MIALPSIWLLFWTALFLHGAANASDEMSGRPWQSYFPLLLGGPTALVVVLVVIVRRRDRSRPSRGLWLMAAGVLLAIGLGVAEATIKSLEHWRRLPPEIGMPTALHQLGFIVSEYATSFPVVLAIPVGFVSYALTRTHSVDGALLIPLFLLATVGVVAPGVLSALRFMSGDYTSQEAAEATIFGLEAAVAWLAAVVVHRRSHPTPSAESASPPTERATRPAPDSAIRLAAALLTGAVWAAVAGSPWADGDSTLRQWPLLRRLADAGPALAGLAAGLALAPTRRRAGVRLLLTSAAVTLALGSVHAFRTEAVGRPDITALLDEWPLHSRWRYEGFPELAWPLGVRVATFLPALLAGFAWPQAATATLALRRTLIALVTVGVPAAFGLVCARSWIAGDEWLQRRWGDALREATAITFGALAGLAFAIAAIATLLSRRAAAARSS